MMGLGLCGDDAVIKGCDRSVVGAHRSLELDYVR